MEKYGSVGGMSCVLVQFRDSIRINGYIGITCSAYSCDESDAIKPDIKDMSCGKGFLAQSYMP